MNMFDMLAKFGEFPTMTLQDIKETKNTDGRARAHTHAHGQRESSIPQTRFAVVQLEKCVLSYLAYNVLYKISPNDSISIVVFRF